MAPLNARGFTLLEVLIALAIASIGLTAVLTLGLQTIGTEERVERTTQAVLLAQQKMAEFESGATQLSRENQPEPFDAPNDNFTWEIAFQSTPITGLRQLTLTVSWLGASPEMAVTLDSYVRD